MNKSEKSCFDNVSTTDLKKMVQERKKWLRRVYTFVKAVINECGELIRKEELNSNTKIEKGINKFNGFNIRLLTGMTMMGGNMIKISHQSSMPVLDLYWQFNEFDANECKVEFFTDDEKLKNQLDKTMRNRKRLIERYLRKKEGEKKRSLLKNEDSHERSKLLKTAERLGL